MPDVPFQVFLHLFWNSSGAGHTIHYYSILPKKEKNLCSVGLIRAHVERRCFNNIALYRWTILICIKKLFFLVHGKKCIVLTFSFLCFSRPVLDSILIGIIKSCHIFHLIMLNLKDREMSSEAQEHAKYDKLWSILDIESCLQRYDLRLSASKRSMKLLS